MPLARATFDDIVLAESPTWETVEGNIYFPPTAIKDKSLFVPIDKVTYSTSIPGAAWYYPNPYDAASNIKDHVAFYTTESVKVIVE
ncbi:hypothetical protein AtubIFM54640_000856 [Aspergillus tubingensis]|nr:hypothetical protein AtubIFM54640_000856 [Aspergillus tubingensis]GLB14912.1 hypothetical protein AtubIFM61612_004717 [Aspergillus tubingensis]